MKLDFQTGIVAKSRRAKNDIIARNLGPRRVQYESDHVTVRLEVEVP